MWSHLIKIASLSKGALVVGVAASAALVSNAQFSNTPSQNELPAATLAAVVSAPPVMTPPANSPSSSVAPKSSEMPAVQQPASSSPASPSTTSGDAASDVIKECVLKYTAIRAKGDSASNSERETASATCMAAIQASGLTSSEFAAKFGLITGPVLTTTPKTEHGTATLGTAYQHCLHDWRNYAETGSTACHELLVASGLSAEDFWTKFEAWAVQQPQTDETTTPTTDITALVNDCFAKYTARDLSASDACKKAMAASGLSGDDFWKKFGTPAKPSTEPKPSTTPANGWEARYALIVECLKLKNSLTSTPETARVAAASEACNKAMDAMGMSSTDFWAKFGSQLNTATTKPSTKPEPTASPKPIANTAELSQLVAKCLDLYKAITSTGDTHSVSEACGAAIRASGMSSADFWAKYHPNQN